MNLSPLTQKRISSFKKNKRGYVSLIIFLTCFVLSLFAEIIANDEPIIISYDDKFYFPIVKEYPETTFGGDFPTPTDYRDEYISNKINKKGWMIWPIIKFSYDTINYKQIVPNPAPPSKENVLGTDDQGRDVFARLLYGFRLSVLFGLILTFLSSIVGIFAGAIQGYFGGKLDLFFQRFLEIWGSLPQLFILVILSSIIAPSFWSLLLILLLFQWTSLVGVVRAEFLRTRNFEYVKAAKALGLSDMKIILRHVLPNALIATLTFVPFILCGSVIALTSLDFLGLGLPAGSPSLGDVLRQGKENLSAPWLGFSGFFALGFLLILLVFIGEAFRDAFDSKKH